MWEPMLDEYDRYISEVMVSLINIDNVTKEPICGYRNRNISWRLILSGYLKVNESLIIRFIIFWVNIILNHIDITTIFLGMKALAYYI